MITSAYYLIIKIKLLTIFFLIASFLSGCASISKGVTQALLEKAESEDTRICQVQGKPLQELNQGLAKNRGDKNPDGTWRRRSCSGIFHRILEKLAKELNLNSRSGDFKIITLAAPLFPDQKTGNLRVSRLLNEDTGKKLTFYELTWSEFPEKKKGCWLSTTLEITISGEPESTAYLRNSAMTPPPSNYFI